MCGKDFISFVCIAFFFNVKVVDFLDFAVEPMEKEDFCVVEFEVFGC